MELQELQKTRRLNLSGFVELEKGIMPEIEFNEKYVKSGKYELFTEKNVADFSKAISDDIAKGIDGKQMIEYNQQLGSLKRVYFQKSNNDDVVSLFVREIVEDNLEKGGGEGSRGGKVIGHTKSGAPIYESSSVSKMPSDRLRNHFNKARYTSQDHKEVAEKYSKMADELKDNDENKARYNSLSKYHGDMHHTIEDRKKEYKQNKHIINSTLSQEGKHTKNTLRMQADNKSYKKKHPNDDFDKGFSDDLEKGQLTSAFDSYGNNKLSFNKTGKEIKTQITTVLLPLLVAQQTQLEADLKTVAKDITIEPEGFVSDYEYRGFSKILPKVARYNYSQTENYNNVTGKYDQSDEQKLCSQYNQIADNLVGTMADIQYASLLARNLDDKKTYELTPNQVVSMQF